MIDYIKGRVVGAALSAASVLVVMQLFLPSMFDLLFDLMMVGLVYVAAKFNPTA